MTESLTDLGEAARELAAEVRADRRERRRHDRKVLALLIVVALLIIGLGALGVSNRRLSDRIEDCTTSGGDCYERGSRRTAEAIAELVLADMAVAVCARQPGVDTLPEMQRCVRDTLAGAGG